MHMFSFRRCWQVIFPSVRTSLYLTRFVWELQLFIAFLTLGVLHLFHFQPSGHILVFNPHIPDNESISWVHFFHMFIRCTISYTLMKCVQLLSFLLGCIFLTDLWVLYIFGIWVLGGGYVCLWLSPLTLSCFLDLLVVSFEHMFLILFWMVYREKCLTDSTFKALRPENCWIS